MTDPIYTLIELSNQMYELDVVQDWINSARLAAPRNQYVQTELDRKQQELNDKRQLIETLMLNISSRN